MPPSHGPDVGERILQAVGAKAPADVLTAFRFCLNHVTEPISVERVAEACGIKRRALEYRFRRAGLAPPGTCIVRCRLLLAVHHLERGSDSIERVAMEHGFGTAGALRKALVRHFGVAPRSLRRSGAFEAAMLGFVDTIRRHHGTHPSH